MISALDAQLVYLATPYRNYPQGPDAAFRDACRLAARLIPAGVFVYSPIAHSHVVAHFGALDRHDMGLWGPLNRVMLARCDVLAVAQLSGWAESEGIAEEVAAFVKAGKPIYDVDPSTLVMTRRPPARPVRDRHDGPDEAAMDADRRAYLGHAAPTTPDAALAHDKTPDLQGGSSV